MDYYFFEIMSLRVEMYLQWKCQISPYFVSGRTCKITGGVNYIIYNIYYTYFKLMHLTVFTDIFRKFWNAKIVCFIDWGWWCITRKFYLDMRSFVEGIGENELPLEEEWRTNWARMNAVLHHCFLWSLSSNNCLEVKEISWYQRWNWIQKVKQTTED